jgi:hypothetical protein
VQLASNLTKGIDSCKPQVFGKEVNVTFSNAWGFFLFIVSLQVIVSLQDLPIRLFG